MGIISTAVDVEEKIGLFSSSFVLPEGMKGRFAVVKLWPNLKAAEDENIARLKITASRMGLKCIEITPEGEIIGGRGFFISSENCDFVIHLHFETPKIYDVFSFVALWNPVKFYHDWGYERFSKHLLTHDDFLSCSSTWADDHVRRLISGDHIHLPPKFTLYHSLSEPVFQPLLGGLKLFYAGINWERLGKGRSRHQELLDLLDKTGDLRIYGPKTFQGVDVWAGYDSYQKEIPFDGISMIREIAKCGASLVLSSDAHKQSELMSNRLFESLAAGALIICDENPFARKYFGDSILYIDTRDRAEKQYEKVVEHLAWANSNPESANEMAVTAQNIFLEIFSLDRSIAEIYRGFSSRKNELESRIFPVEAKNPLVRIFCLVDKCERELICDQINALSVQSYKKFSVTFVVEPNVLNEFRGAIDEVAEGAGFEYEYFSSSFFEGELGEIKRNLSIGKILQDCIDNLRGENYCLFLAPNERMLSGHLKVLVGGALRQPGRPIYTTACLYRHSDGARMYHDYRDDVLLTDYFSNMPNGFGRHLINIECLQQDLSCVLPYLNQLSIIAFFADTEMQILKSATLIIDIQRIFPGEDFDRENELSVLSDYHPWFKKFLQQEKKFISAASMASLPPGTSVMPVAFGSSVILGDLNNLSPAALSFKNLSKGDKVKIFASLLESVLPKFVTRPIFWIHDIFSKN